MFRSIFCAVFSSCAVFSCLIGLPSAGFADDPHPVTVEVTQRLGDRKPDRPFVLLVTLKIQPGKQTQLIEAMRAATPPTRQEDGNVRYQLLGTPSDPLTYQLSEQWKSVADLDAHLKQPYVVKLLSEFDSILAEPPGLNVMIPVPLKLSKSR